MKIKEFLVRQRGLLEVGCAMKSLYWDNESEDFVFKICLKVTDDEIEFVNPDKKHDVEEVYKTCLYEPENEESFYTSLANLLGYGPWLIKESEYEYVENGESPSIEDFRRENDHIIERFGDNLLYDLYFHSRKYEEDVKAIYVRLVDGIKKHLNEKS